MQSPYLAPCNWQNRFANSSAYLLGTGKPPQCRLSTTLTTRSTSARVYCGQGESGLVRIAVPPSSASFSIIIQESDDRFSFGRDSELRFEVRGGSVEIMSGADGHSSRLNPSRVNRAQCPTFEPQLGNGVRCAGVLDSM